MPSPASCSRPPVLVLGSGMAGLFAALALAPAPVVLATKTGALSSGSTAWAQGGIAAACGPDDSPLHHAADTLAAGAGLGDPAIAGLLTEEGAAAVEALRQQGAPFDRNADGSLCLGREAAHSFPRIVHAGGDSTGRVIGDWLVQQASRAEHVAVLTDCFVQDLIVEGGRACGALVCGRRFGWRALRAGAVVLATGGWGMAWPGTTNPQENTGDGAAMAARAGAVLADMEFMQFHPTALAGKTNGGARLSLLTEALRGAGATLHDWTGARFMPGEHPLAELAPRDVVARAVGSRIAAGRSVFLDLRPAVAARGEAAFPQVLAACRQEGFDPLSAPVPVIPAAHYAMGGVMVDSCGRASLPGLWAVGEVSCTGVHGANRLASNSLLEGIVFGSRAAAAIRDEAASLEGPSSSMPERLPAVLHPNEAHAVSAAVRAAMGRHVGLIREEAGLTSALAAFEALQSRLDSAKTAPSADFNAVRLSGEACNLTLVARLVAEAALRRTESRGAHWRTDFPDEDPRQARRMTQRLDAAGGGSISSPAGDSGAVLV